MLEADGFSNVRYEDCMIPAWKHNPEGDVLEMTAPYYKKIGYDDDDDDDDDD